MKFMSGIPNNPRYLILLEPLWSIFGTAILLYASLYMKEIGLSNIEIGTTNSIFIFFACIFHIIAGPVTNKLGRKKTIFIFDLLSWSVPMLIWAVAQNFWYFAIAAAINASNKIVIVGYNCLMIEDTSEDKRARIYALFHVVGPIFGLLTPVYGFFISKHGMVPTLRIMYILGMITMTTLFIVRNLLIRETEAGKQVMEKYSKMTVSQNFKEYFSTVSTAFKNKRVIMVTLIYTITCFALAMNIFQTIFLKERLGFSVLDLSYIPLINAVIGIGLGVYIVPKFFNKLSGELVLTCSIALCIIGFAAFLNIPFGNLLIMLIAIGIWYAADFLILTYRDAVLMNNTGEHEKADVFSAVQTINTLICIPSGFIAGMAYDLNPNLPFILNIVLFASVLVISVFLLLGSRKKCNAASNIEGQIG